MTPLETLKRIALADLNLDPGEPGETRRYCLDHASELAEAFGVTRDVFFTAVEAVDADKIAGSFLGSIKTATAKTLAAKATARATAAQLAADRLSASASWGQGHAFILPLDELFACLTTRRGFLLFTLAEDVTIAIPMGRLFDVRALKRPDMGAPTLTADGLTFRWGTAGRLTFRPGNHYEVSRDERRVVSGRRRRRVPGDWITIHVPSHVAIPEPVAPIELVPVRSCRPVASNDAATVKAARTTCLHGHPYTEENTRRTPNGSRCCLACRTARYARRDGSRVA